jgi:hypothetical protein
MRWLALLLTGLLALAQVSFAGSFDALGFSADFPAAPVIHPEQDGARDAAGRPLSKAVLVQAGVAHQWSAVVVVETFDGPLPSSVDTILVANRDNSLAGWNMKLTASNPILQDGHKALVFRFAHPGGRGGGAGIVAVREGERPRVYLLFTMYTPKAEADIPAALERMVGSFHIN